MTRKKLDSISSGAMKKQEAEPLKSHEEIMGSEIEESKCVFDEAEAFRVKQSNEVKKKNAAERDFAKAADFAKRQIQSDGLESEIMPYFKVRYTVAQGLKAAIHGREDGIATFVLQRDILIRLDGIKFLLWCVLVLLVFIAYKLA
ncbi:MAG: hypothetical protein NT086_21755 [Proteobacteria bacterium]|nr:hypothetical protein [Pseudomonadota bacterium]